MRKIPCGQVQGKVEDIFQTATQHVNAPAVGPVLPPGHGAVGGLPPVALGAVGLPNIRTLLFYATSLLDAVRQRKKGLRP